MSEWPGLEESSGPGSSPGGPSKGIQRVAARLEFPVNSKAHLIEQLGGPKAPFSMLGITEVAVERWVRFLPAHLFPVVSQENFTEKLDELYASTPKPPMTADEIIAMLTYLAQENSAALEELLQMFRGVARQSLR